MIDLLETYFSDQLTLAGVDDDDDPGPYFCDAFETFERSRLYLLGYWGLYSSAAAYSLWCQQILLGFIAEYEP